MSEQDMELEQAMRDFITAYTSNALDRIPTFVQQYSEVVQPELLDFIEEYFAMEAEPELVDVPQELIAVTAVAADQALNEAMIPASSLVALRKEQGILPGKLARAVKLPTDFLGLLERGEIRLISISSRKARMLVERLSLALNRTVDEISMSLRVPTQTSAIRMSAKDASTLNIGKQWDFEEALKQSAELTPEMRAEWLDEQEEEA